MPKASTAIVQRIVTGFRKHWPTNNTKRRGRVDVQLVLAFLFGAPGMGNNQVMKDHYALGSRKR